MAYLDLIFCYLRATNIYVCCIIYYQQNIGQLWNANKLPHPPAKACSRLNLPKCTIFLFRRFHYRWQAKLTEIRRFALGLPMENNLCFSFLLLLLKFQVSSRYPLLVSVYHEIDICFHRAIPVMCCICSLKSHTTMCSQTLTVFRWCGNVFCTWSKLGLFTQPSHLLRKKVPFQSRNTTSSFPVPSGKNKRCSRVNLLSLYIQAEVPVSLHLKTCLL